MEAGKICLSADIYFYILLRIFVIEISKYYRNLVIFVIIFRIFLCFFFLLLWLTRHMEYSQTLPDTITKKNCRILSTQGLSCPEKYWKSCSRSLFSRKTESAEVRLMGKNSMNFTKTPVLIWFEKPAKTSISDINDLLLRFHQPPTLPY